MDDLLHGDAEDDGGCLEPEDLTDRELGIGIPLTAAERAWNRRLSREARERWRRLPDDDPPEALVVDPSTLGTILRTARFRVRRNQRELAGDATVPRATVARVEAGEHADVRLSTLVRLLQACDLRLVVVDAEGTALAEPYGRECWRDGAGRHLPAHLRQYRPSPDHRAVPGGAIHARGGPPRVTVGRRWTPERRTAAAAARAAAAAARRAGQV